MIGPTALVGTAAGPGVPVNVGKLPLNHPTRLGRGLGWGLGQGEQHRGGLTRHFRLGRGGFTYYTGQRVLIIAHLGNRCDVHVDHDPPEHVQDVRRKH
jgi:hypothetical protein